MKAGAAVVAAIVVGLVAGAIVWIGSTWRETAICNGVAGPPPGTCASGLAVPVAAVHVGGVAAAVAFVAVLIAVAVYERR